MANWRLDPPDVAQLRTDKIYLSDALNALGGQGWELAAFDGLNNIFKQPR